jgi:hypothetical protein
VLDATAASKDRNNPIFCAVSDAAVASDTENHGLCKQTISFLHWLPVQVKWGRVEEGVVLSDELAPDGLRSRNIHDHGLKRVGLAGLKFSGQGFAFASSDSRCDSQDE